VSYGPRPWQQTSWDWRAATNFMLGGTGAGLVVAASLIQDETHYPVMLALALVAAGLGAVWLEIGRKLRAIHVFFNPFTSWMTRESFAAVVLFGFGVAHLAFRQPWTQFAAALAAVAFVFCQARILRAAKGIPAWRAPEVVPLVLATSLAEGAGLALLFEPDSFALALFVAALIGRGMAWSGYRAALRQPAIRAALGPAGKALIQIGTLVPLALVLGGIFLPQAAILAAIAAILTGWWFKFVLVTRAALNQGFALPQLPVRGTR
jgi:phenylacetyl-CoA:acceptor oxidoreductase subunit 2